jgi:fatty acid desaturase
MAASCCSSDCRGAHDHPGALERELNLRWWIGVAIVVASCAFAYGAYAYNPLLWIPAALAAWFGTYQTIYSKGCSSCGAPGDLASGPQHLNDMQRATRLEMANRFLAAAVILAAIAGWVLPLLWPLAAIAGWFAISFYVAVWTRYLGCPEVGAIPSLLARRHIATRSAPLERRDARAG